MTVFLRKYRKYVGLVAFVMAFSVALSNVSMTYTQLVCSMKKDKMEMSGESCCCKMEKDNETACENTENTENTGMEEITGQSTLYIVNSQSCCCSVTQNESDKRNYIPVPQNTVQNNLTPQSGEVIGTLPVPNQIALTTKISPEGETVPQGREIIILVSNFRI